MRLCVVRKITRTLVSSIVTKYFRLIFLNLISSSRKFKILTVDEERERYRRQRQKGNENVMLYNDLFMAKQYQFNHHLANQLKLL
jgi:hypothetical protein